MKIRILMRERRCTTGYGERKRERMKWEKEEEKGEQQE